MISRFTGCRNADVVDCLLIPVMLMGRSRVRDPFGGQLTVSVYSEDKGVAESIGFSVE